MNLKRSILTFALIASMLSSSAIGAEPSTVATILHKFKRAQADEEEPEQTRKERLALISDAIQNATDSRWEQMLLVSVGWHESRFSSVVQNCTVKGDNGKAVGIWQSWNAKCDDSLQDWADEAIRHLRSSWRYCRAKTLPQKVEMGVSLYATGRTCHHPVAKARLKLWRSLMGM